MDRRNLLVTMGIILVAVAAITSIAIGGMWTTFSAANDARQSKRVAQAIEQERDARLVASCTEANASAVVQMNAEKILVRELADAVAPQPRTLATALRVAEFLNREDAAITRAHTKRDCSFSALGIHPLTTSTTVSKRAIGIGRATTRAVARPPHHTTTTICRPEGKSGRCHKK